MLVARLHEWAATGRIDGFVMAYLGIADDRLPTPVTDLVPREKIANYPTNFAPMADHNIAALASVFRAPSGPGGELV
jgi:hypothetical protein